MSLSPLSPMDLHAAVVCITGGGSGIGLGLAEEFLKAGSTVIITGRRQGPLEDAKKKLSKLHTFQGDVSDIESRQKLVAWLLENFPKLNILVNNAGIQRRVTAAEETDDWSERALELKINIEAPVHLMHLLTPHFRKQPEACFMNVTSGLAFLPTAFAPLYGATKAAMHSFIMSSRYAYEKTNIRLVEICPPAVKTNLGDKNSRNHDYGEPCNEYGLEYWMRIYQDQPD
ncbi:hypothetical protein WJX84_012151 [Apatococcus fuscideae]|uniref:NAD(P)-binding protein n=1 Tax=Apatococcus fuscideae TaxID=2026836 RepID=A0AAW1TDE1_9CHLO